MKDWLPQYEPVLRVYVQFYLCCQNFQPTVA